MTNYLITGYWGEPHVTAENDRGINAAMFGAGRFVLPVGEQFKAEYIGNNTIRVYDGKLLDNGAAAGIPAGEYIDLLVPEAGQGMKRNDLIVFQYEQDASTLIEKGTFVVLSGTETSGTATDPSLTQADLLTGKATFDQMAMWRVSVSGTTIAAPVQLFTVYKAPVNEHKHSASDIDSGTLGLNRGGTGATTAAAARTKLDVYSTDEVDGLIEGIADDVTAITKRQTSSSTSITLQPNTLYVFGTMSTLTVTLGGTVDATKVQEYKFRFTSGATATKLTLPSSVIGSVTVEKNHTYEVSIVDNYLVYQSWAVS